MNIPFRLTVLATLCAAALLPIRAADGPLSAVLQSAVDQHLVAGTVVLVAGKDKILDVEAAGWSSLGAKTPMKTDALFWIASMSKSFTGAALMMLVDEGKISLDDPVEKYLPEFKGQMVSEDRQTTHPPRHPVTIREIMCHTSGVITPQEKEFKRGYVLKDNVAQIGKLPLLWEPGTKFSYNNNGIDTGGRIIEVVSGLPYTDFMQQRLFTPLGLQDTTFWPTEEQASRLAYTARMTGDKSGLEDVRDYMRNNLPQSVVEKLAKGAKIPEPLLDNFGGGIIPDYVDHYGEPAGGLYSTAADVGRFCQMLLNGGVWQGKRYLSENAIHQMSASQTGNVSVNPQETYGVGWFVKIRADEGPAVGSYGHRGARRTVMWIDPTHQLVMVALLQRFDMTGEQQKEFYGSIFHAMIEKFSRQ